MPASYAYTVERVQRVRVIANNPSAAALIGQMAFEKDMSMTSIATKEELGVYGYSTDAPRDVELRTVQEGLG